MLTPWKKSYDQPRWHIKKQRHYLANKGPSGQGYGFSSGHVWMWELDYEESWALKNWCFWTVVLEKTLESPLDCKEIQPVHPKGDQSWAFIGRTDAEAETPILWPPHAKSWLVGKDPDAGKDWGQEGKGTTEDEMAGWHHQLDGHESEQTPFVMSLWWTGRPGVLRFMGSQRVRHDWATELNWTNVLHQHSEVVLWNLLSIQMLFRWICGGESGLPVLFLCHLRTAPLTQMYWTVFWTLRERARVGWYGTMALKHVNYHVWFFCDPTDDSPPGSSVHGISQARILEWTAISFSRGSSRPRDWTHISCTGRQILYHWPTREASMTLMLTLF